MQKIRATKLATQLAAAFPGRNIPVISIEAWANELMALSEREATSVVGRLIYSATAPPSVAELLEAANAELPYNYGNQGTRMSALPSNRSGGISFDEWLERNPDKVATARKVFPSYFVAKDRDNVSAEDIVS